MQLKTLETPVSIELKQQINRKIVQIINKWALIHTKDEKVVFY